MTEKLASRVAGLKLSAIVAILLIPMLVLSYFMVNALRQDIALAEKEQLGADLVRLVLPIAIRAASNSGDEDAAAILRDSGRGVAGRLGLDAEMSSAIADAVTYVRDRRYIVRSLERLQLANATASNIILDPAKDTYFLGSVATQYLPNALADYVDLLTLESRAMKDGRISAEEAASLIFAAGAWTESLEHATSSIEQVAAFANAPEVYRPALASLQGLKKHAGALTQLLTEGLRRDMAADMANSSLFAAGSDAVIGNMRTVWTVSLEQFDDLLARRLAGMKLQLYSLLGLAVVACLIGVGGAALMFKSTLRRLDDVKHARDEAHVARREAEQVANELLKVNEDVIRLNADLNRNIRLLRESQDESLKKGKMAQLGQLTATVAHELRNPLGAVRTSVFLLERKLKGKGLGIEAQLDRINNGVTRCDNIISQLLDFARTKSLNLETVGFDEWLASLIEEEAQKLPAAVAIECALEIGSLRTSIDPARMNRVFINLLTNASEALVGKGDDPGKFAVRTPTISVTSAITARGIEVEVSDNGPGIPPEILERIFEPLFTTKNFGTGLGLPAVQKILEQHGGGLEVQSVVGQGATFTAWWPHVAEDKEAA